MQKLGGYSYDDNGNGNRYKSYILQYKWVYLSPAAAQKKSSGNWNSLLGYPDSNQERQDQNLQCYHYTIAQCLIALQRYNIFR